jgi:hypothetical protein
LTHVVHWTLVSLLLICNTACGGSAIVVSSQPLGSSEHLTRIYIGVEQHSLDAEYPEALGETLCRELKKRHVTAKFRILHELSADGAETADEADRFHAQALLLLQFVRGNASGSGFSTVSYDGILGKRSAPKPTWRVRVRGRRGGMGGSVQGMMEAVAERLAEQMEKDGVIDKAHNARP